MPKQKVSRGFVGEGYCRGAMNRATGPGALPRQHRGELAAKMLGRCVGPSRSGWWWRRRWGAGASRGSGARRRVRSSISKTRSKRAERLQDCQPSREKMRAAETVDAAGEKEAVGTPGTIGSIEAARDPKAVWVNGAVGEPEVVGPAGSVWVTRSGEEEAGGSSPQGCERKGRPGTMGHGSILELWLKVQAMRAASGCGVGSRVELHPVPAGEGPVERGIPGRAFWIETSQGGVTGPWVRGQARPFPQASGQSTVTGTGPGCGRRQAGKVPPVVAPGAVELNCAPAPSPWERAQVIGQPEVMEITSGCGTASDQCGRGQSGQDPGALTQGALRGGSPGLWGNVQAAGNLNAVVVPRVVEEEATPVCVPGMWQRRHEVEDKISEGFPGVWGMGQPVGVPCVTTKEEARCGCGPGLREKGQDMWVESGSGGDLGLWEAAQTMEPAGPGVQEAGSQQVPQGLWGIEQAMRVPRTLGKETDCESVPGLWGTAQLPGLSQAVVVPEAQSEGTLYGGVPDLWERQRVLGTPPAEAVGDIHSGSVLSLQEGRQASGEPEALVPGAAGAAGPPDAEADCGAVSCPCGRRQTLRASEIPGMSKTASTARHRHSPVGVPTALGVPRSGRRLGRVPAAVWVSGPVCREINGRNVSNPWKSCTVPVPLGSEGAVAPEELWSVGENAGSWERRQAVRVPGAPVASGPPDVETGFLERRHLVGTPVTGEVSPAGGRHVASRVLGPVWEETGSASGSGVSRERQVDKSSTTMGASTSARMPEPVGERTGSGCIAASSGNRQTTGMSMAVGPSEAVMQETLSEGLLDLLGRRQTAGLPVAARLPVALGVPTASRVHGPQMVGEGVPGDGSGTWRRQGTGAPTAARSPGPLEGETGFEGVSGLWRRRHSGAFPETARVPVPLGRIGAGGVPAARHVPAAVWVTESSGESSDVGASGLTAMSRQSAEGAEPSGEQTGDRSVLGMIGRGQAVGVSYTRGHEAWFWNCPRSAEEQTAHENIPRVSGIRMAVAVPPVSREEIDPSHFRDHPQQSGRRQVREMSGIGVRGNDWRENCVGEDTLRGTF
ncbi:collagen, type I, alpha 1b [Cavia porcellus]|uniref:collagen, type I, alpha 1b n=1 Tax=Cavia porcellus TaxID=10141 RepID=UPI002FE05598